MESDGSKERKGRKEGRNKKRLFGIEIRESEGVVESPFVNVRVLCMSRRRLLFLEWFFFYFLVRLFLVSISFPLLSRQKTQRFNEQPVSTVFHFQILPVGTEEMAGGVGRRRMENKQSDYLTQSKVGQLLRTNWQLNQNFCVSFSVDREKYTTDLPSFFVFS